jgi:hypothetical protein
MDAEGEQADKPGDEDADIADHGLPELRLGLSAGIIPPARVQGIPGKTPSPRAR